MVSCLCLFEGKGVVCLSCQTSDYSVEPRFGKKVRYFAILKGADLQSLGEMETSVWLDNSWVNEVVKRGLKGNGTEKKKACN